jgi:hypothetical protein
VTLTGLRRSHISNDESFDECIILEKEAFDPDAVFMEDIVEDDVLPRLSLAVDGLTEGGKKDQRRMEMPTADELAVNEAIQPSRTLPVTTSDSQILEVYGWESNMWKKVRGYLGF